MSYENLKSIHVKLIHAQFEYWSSHVAFTFNWWFLVIVSIVAWFIWFLTVDTRNLREIIMYGMMVLIITTVLDGTGTELNVWSYKVLVTPTFARFIPVDFAGMPIIYMWVYQRYQTWRSFIISSTITAVIFSVIFEPLLTWMGIYVPKTWSNIYSIPIYLAIALFSRWFVKHISHLERSR